MSISGYVLRFRSAECVAVADGWLIAGRDMDMNARGSDV